MNLPQQWTFVARYTYYAFCAQFCNSQIRLPFKSISNNKLQIILCNWFIWLEDYSMKSISFHRVQTILCIETIISRNNLLSQTSHLEQQLKNLQLCRKLSHEPYVSLFSVICYTQFTLVNVIYNKNLSELWTYRTMKINVGINFTEELDRIPFNKILITIVDIDSR